MRRILGSIVASVLTVVPLAVVPLAGALVACAAKNTPAGTSAESRASAISPPLVKACAELTRLRALEQGTETRTAPFHLDVDCARELFRRAEALGFSGGFALSRRGEVVVAEGYGLANRAQGLRITSSTSYDIGSVTKQFTAAAILRLEELCRLHTEDTIAKHLPGVPADKEAITLHHLLTHSAGFPHDVGTLESLPSRDDAVRQILESKLRSVPGSQYSYSNVGYVLLAAIVDRVSGTSYERFLRDEFWTPLDMSSTGMVLHDRRGLEIAEGFTFVGPLPATRAEHLDKDGPSWLVRGAGHVKSTLADMTKWGEALRTGAVLTDVSRTKLFWPHIHENVKGVSYSGYGWAITFAPDDSFLITHDGSSGIHFDFLSILPEHEAVLTAFNTQRRSPWNAFLDELTPVLTGTAEIRLPAVNVRLDERLDDYAGEYEFATGETAGVKETLRVNIQDGRVTIPAKNPTAIRLFNPWPAVDTASEAPLGDRAAMIALVIDSIARGDLTPLLTRLPSSVSVAEEEAFWKEYWPRWVQELGAYQGVDFIDTVQVEDTLRSLALLRFEKSSMVVGFVHSKDSKIYVDTMSQWFLPEIVLVPRGGGEFIAFHPRTRRTLRVAFGGSANSRTLTVGEGPDARVGRRTEAR